MERQRRSHQDPMTARTPYGSITELVKKPKDLLYVVVHEMLHLIEPTAMVG